MSDIRISDFQEADKAILKIVKSVKQLNTELVENSKSAKNLADTLAGSGKESHRLNQ